jgi:hypothetical protein
VKRILLSSIFLLAFSGYIHAADVDLNEPQWLGNLQLADEQKAAIKKAVEKALTAPIDAAQECGEVRGDCVARAAREWMVDGQKYREIIVYIHTVGQASGVVGQAGGQWPVISF